MSHKIKHFFEYLDYTNLSLEDHSFSKPYKNDKGIFIAKLNNPFAFYLPKSELCDMFQDNYGNNVINYIINLDLHSEIIQFLENFDTLCITSASENSVSWFGKNLDSEKLIKYYNTLYELSEDERSLYLPIGIEPDQINDIIRYNDNDDTILSVKITGIEFFKQTFRWTIQFNSIVDSIEESEDDDDMNFDDLVDNNFSNKIGGMFEEQIVYSEDEHNVESEDEEQVNLDITSTQEEIENNSCSDEDNIEYAYDEQNYKEHEYQDQEYDNDNIEENQQIEYENNEQIEYQDHENVYYNNDDEEQNYQESREHLDEEQQNEDEQEIREEHQNEEEQIHEAEDVEPEEFEEQEESDSAICLKENEDQVIHDNNESPHIDGEIDNSEVSEQNLEDEIEGQQNTSTEIKKHEINQQNMQENVVDSDNKSTNNNNDKNIEKSYTEKQIYNEEKLALNKSMIDELASDDNDIENDNIENNLSKDTIHEIESIISEKRLQVKKYTINATRAKRASDSLSMKANEVSKEIELYENKLRACQISN